MSADGPARRREIEDSTAARLAEIVAAAERAAKEVIDEAEAEARERLSDAHEEAERIVTERLAGLAAITGEIEGQAEALRRGAEALQAALRRARAEFGETESLGGSASMSRRETDPEGDAQRPAGPSLTVVGPPGPPAFEPRSTSHAQPFDPQSTPEPLQAEEQATPQREPEPALEPEPESIGTPAGARLLATQMAVSGSSREEIAARLRSGFAIADPASILDAILGPER